MEDALTDVSLRARFERFPATVKGAFVVRGEDRDPHQITFKGARVVRVPGPGVRELPLTTVTLGVPPHKDVFVPFEFPIGDLEPGWYGLEADVDIDGAPRTLPGGRHFCVPWPRSAIRAASLKVDRSVEVDGATVTIDRCQSGTEGITVRFAVQPSQPVTIRLFADGGKVEMVEQDIDPESGKGSAKAYPLLKSHGALRIEVTGKSRGSAAEIELDLPS
jgi:hypothetical protein